MLFVLKNCHPAQYEDDFDKHVALSNLLRSHGFRYNLVFGDRKIFEEVLHSKTYGKEDKLFANNILESYREYGQLIDFFNHIVEIDFDFSGVKSTIVSDKAHIRMGYGLFTNNDRTMPTMFLSENPVDVDFYKKIGEPFSKVKRVNTGINFTPFNGGGSQTKDFYQKFKNDKKICLCIIDTDKKHPAGGEGSTAGRFRREERNLNDTVFVKVLDVHEIECLIPLEVIEKTLIHNKSSSAVIDNLDSIKSISFKHPRFRHFFDHKKGIDLKKAIHLDVTHGEHYLPAILEDKKTKTYNCLNQKKCHGCNSCYEINGFGENLLAHSLLVLERENLRTLTIDPALSIYWDNIGKLVLNWGCIPPEKRVRS